MTSKRNIGNEIIESLVEMLEQVRANKSLKKTSADSLNDKRICQKTRE